MSEYDIVFLTNDIKELSKARNIILEMLRVTDYNYDRQTEHEMKQIQDDITKMINKLYQKIEEIENEQDC